MKKTVSAFVLGALFISILSVSLAANAQAGTSTLTFAAFGDYGTGDEHAAAVASMVNSWNPDLIVTQGDDYYTDAGGTGDDRYDRSTGQFYCRYLTDIHTATGTFCPAGLALRNRFFPALGGHDYSDAGTTDGLPTTYTDYFKLPGSGYTSSSNNERYYDFVSGPVHFFILNTNNGSDGEYPREPDGTDSTSVQAEWLQRQLGSSTSTWNIVVMHNAPYTSGSTHGSDPEAQWPYAQWGADAVLSGHEHLYERILRDGIVYFVNGLGGAWTYPFSHRIVDGSAYRFTGNYGAMRVTASDASLGFQFYSVENGGTLLDSYTITRPHNTPTPTLPPYSTGWRSPRGQGPLSGGDGNGFEVGPANALADDGAFAMDVNSGTKASTGCLDGDRDKHRFFNYGIVMPAGSTVRGIQLRLDAKADSTAGNPKMCASLSWDGGSTWSDWKSTPVLTSGERTYLLGSTANLWGHNWTPGELADGNFQVRILNGAANLTTDFGLDWIAVNVVYTNPAIISTYTPAPVQTPTRTPTPLPPPLLASPLNKAVLKTVRANFDWSDVTGAASYQIQVASSTAFSTLYVNAGTTTSLYKLSRDLPGNTTLYWRVRARTAAAAGLWSAVRSFKTANPPSTPSLLAPAHDALVTSYVPLLDWSDSKVPAGTAFYRYQIQISTTSSFSTLYLSAYTSGVTSSRYRPATPLKSNTRYFWRVRSFNTSGHYSSWSAVRSLRAAMLPPNPLSPANAITILRSKLSFTWSSVAGAASYTIQVSRNSDMSSPLINTQVSGTSYTPGNGITLPRNVTLYWRVCANGPNGPSLWSTKFSFLIK